MKLKMKKGAMKSAMKSVNKGLRLGLSVLMLGSTVIAGFPIGLAQTHAEAQILKFDFGTATSPVLEGYAQVSDKTLYTPELGYGLTAATNSRNRSGGDALTNDFLIPGANPYTFLVDLPNGSYNVTVYSGDLLAGTSTTKTTVTIEGELKGTIQSRQAVNSATYAAVVADGQMTIDFGGSAYTNGVVIEPAAPAAPAVPEGLAVSGSSAAGESLYVSLTWGTAANAAAYDVYRGTGAEPQEYSPIARVEAAAYTDTTVAAGGTYSYKIASVSSAGVSSALSVPVTAVVAAQPQPQIPAAPSALAVTSAEAQSVTLQWTESAWAAGYKVYRSGSQNGEYTEIGQVTAPASTYIDTSADTSAVNYYQVKAYNDLGLSEASNTAASPVYIPPQPLPDSDTLRFDFGPGAVQDGYMQVLPGTAYSEGLKYGFTDTSKVDGADRGTSDPLKSDFVSPKGTTFQIDLPNGDYAVNLVSGDQTEATQTAVKVESIQKVQQTDKAAGEYLDINFEIALVDGQLNLEFTGAAPKINSLVIMRKTPRQPGDLPTVYIAGDSTVQTYDEYWKPEAGWGQMIPRFFTDNVLFKNHAIGGRSSKTFISEGRLDEVLRAISPGDYFFVQFGHNDATISVPERYASVPDYKNYLKVYVNGARQRGATPVLVTPMGRRSFDPVTGKFNVSWWTCRRLASLITIPSDLRRPSPYSSIRSRASIMHGLTGLQMTRISRNMVRFRSQDFYPAA
jgi:large repetitive protein